jgi:putative Holliday junction resolvase
VLGLDPGERRIGVALSDPTGIIASPLTVIDRRTEDPAKRLRALCAEYDVGTIVVGLPVSLSGAEGAAAEKARRFGEEVHVITGRKVVFADERFTSVQAERLLLEEGMRRSRRRTTTDKVAAALMLQGYLDRVRREEA